MSLKLTINGTDYTAKWRLYESHWTMRAHMGESSPQTRIVLDDPDGTIPHSDLASMKIVTITEDASGTERTLFRGRVSNKSMGRGPFRTGAGMRWAVTCHDSNYDLRGIRITDSRRPEEDDRTRVIAYINGYLNGAGSTNAHARDSTEMDGEYVINTDLITLPAEDYRDTFPAELFLSICELSAKTFFVYVTDDGEMKLYYAPFSDQTLAALDVSLADDGSADESLGIYAPDIEPTMGEHDGQRVITGGGVRYGEDEFYEDSDTAGGEADHDKYEEHFTDEFISTQSQAQRFLESTVDSRSQEDFTFLASWEMAAENAHRLKAGMALSIRMASANEPNVIDQRCVQLTLQPLHPDANGEARYKVTAEIGLPRYRPFQRNLRRRPTPAVTLANQPETVDVDPGIQYIGGDSISTATLTGAIVSGAAESGKTVIVGDFIILEASTDAAGTTPTIDGDFTAEGSGYAVGGSTNMGGRVAWKFLDASDISSGSWSFTNANTIDFVIYRGVDPSDPTGTLVNVQDLATPDPDGNTPAVGGPVAVAFLQTQNATSIQNPHSTSGGSAYWLDRRVDGHDGETAVWDTLGAPHIGDIPSRVIDWTGNSYWTCHAIPLNADPSPTESVPGDLNADLVGDEDAAARWDHAHIVFRATDPTVNDDEDEGLPAGTVWRNTTTDVEFRSTDATAGAAVWEQLGGADDDQTAAEVPFTPTGTIAATDTQAAVAEVATDAAAALVAHAANADAHHPADSGGEQRILLADGRSTPFAFEDMLQMDDGSDFLWSD